MAAATLVFARTLSQHTDSKAILSYIGHSMNNDHVLAQGKREETSCPRIPSKIRMYYAYLRHQKDINRRYERHFSIEFDDADETEKAHPNPYTLKSLVAGGRDELFLTSICWACGLRALYVCDGITLHDFSLERYLTGTTASSSSRGGSTRTLHSRVNETIRRNRTALQRSDIGVVNIDMSEGPIEVKAHSLEETFADVYRYVASQRMRLCAILIAVGTFGLESSHVMSLFPCGSPVSWILCNSWGQPCARSFGDGLRTLQAKHPDHDHTNGFTLVIDTNVLPLRTPRNWTPASTRPLAGTHPQLFFTGKVDYSDTRHEAYAEICVRKTDEHLFPSFARLMRRAERLAQEEDDENDYDEDHVPRLSPAETYWRVCALTMTLEMHPRHEHRMEGVVFDYVLHHPIESGPMWHMWQFQCFTRRRRGSSAIPVIEQRLFRGSGQRLLEATLPLLSKELPRYPILAEVEAVPHTTERERHPLLRRMSSMGFAVVGIGTPESAVTTLRDIVEDGGRAETYGTTRQEQLTNLQWGNVLLMLRRRSR